MRKFTDETIKKVLDEAATSTVEAVCKKHKVAPATYYIWKRKYGGNGSHAIAKGESSLIGENRRLREALGKALVELEMLKAGRG